MTQSSKIVSLTGSNLITATAVVVSFWSGMLLMYALQGNKPLVLPMSAQPVTRVHASGYPSSLTQGGGAYPVVCILDSE